MQHLPQRPKRGRTLLLRQRPPPLPGLQGESEEEEVSNMRGRIESQPWSDEDTDQHTRRDGLRMPVRSHIRRAWAKCGPRAACGPLKTFFRPAKG